MLCDFTNTDEEATARRALNGVHGAAAAIHKLSLSFFGLLLMLLPLPAAAVPLSP